MPFTFYFFSCASDFWNCLKLAYVYESCQATTAYMNFPGRWALWRCDNVDTFCGFRNGLHCARGQLAPNFTTCRAHYIYTTNQSVPIPLNFAHEYFKVDRPT